MCLGRSPQIQMKAADGREGRSHSSLKKQRNKKPTFRGLEVLLIENEPDDVELFRNAIQLTGLNVNLSKVANVKAAMDYMLGKGGYGKRQAYPFPETIVLD